MGKYKHLIFFKNIFMQQIIFKSNLTHSGSLIKSRTLYFQTTKCKCYKIQVGQNVILPCRLRGRMDILPRRLRGHMDIFPRRLRGRIEDLTHLKLR